MERSNPLAVCLAFSFVLVAFAVVGSTPAAAQSRWGIAMPIETDNTGDAFSPSVAIDGQGNAFAVWSQFDGTRTNAWAARFVPGFGWETPTTIETETFGTGVIDVAADASGNAIAVWEQNDASLTNIWANRYVAGVGWGIAAPIESGSAGNAYSPQVAMDASGKAMAAWQYHDGIRWRAYANLYWGAWGTPVAIDPGTGGGVLDHALAVDPNGNAVVVVSQCCGPADIYANNYSASGGAWSVPRLIETDDAGDAISTSVAMDAGGNAIATWRQWDGTDRTAMANRYAAGTGWGLALAIETNPGDVGGTPSVAMDGAGNAIAVWEQYDGVRYNIWTNRFDGSTWGMPVLLESAPGNAGSPDLAVNSAGEALAVWAETEGAWADIWASRFRPATGWGAPERIETANMGSAIAPAVAIDADGSGTAVWMQHDGAVWSIWANRFTADTVPPSLEVRSPVDGTLTNIPSVTIAGTTEPGAAVTINGSAVTVLGDGTFSQTYAGLADGTHTWVIVASDVDGNAKAETRTVTVDTTPPNLVFTYPIDGQTFNRPTFLVAGQTEEGARLVVGGFVVDVGVGGIFGFWMTLPEGPVNVWSTATDSAGNARSVVWSVTIDTTPPFLALTSPAPGLTNNPSVTVSGMTDPGTTVLINGTSVPVDPQGRFSLTVTLPDGEHIFDVNALDAALNVAFRSVIVTVDTTEPVLTLTAPSAGASTNNPVVTVSGTTEPDVHLVVNGLVVSVAPDGSFAFELALREGANTVRATATDPAGNVATASVTVTYTNPVPGLQQQLQALQAQLDAVQTQLDTTNQALQDAQESLAAANARLDSLQTNLLLGLIAVVLILGVLQFGLAWMGRRKGGAEREPGETGEKPKT